MVERRVIAAPAVVVGEEGEALGMAYMVAGLLEANMAESRQRRRVAARARGAVVLEASDRGLGVTVIFKGDQVIVEPSYTPGVQVLSGAWLDMADLCSGRLSPLSAVARRRVRIIDRGRLGLLVAAGYVLKAPRSAYANDA